MWVNKIQNFWYEIQIFKLEKMNCMNDKILPDLTGWNMQDVRQKMNLEGGQYLQSGDKNPAASPKNTDKKTVKHQWWKNLW